MVISIGPQIKAFIDYLKALAHRMVVERVGDRVVVAGLVSKNLVTKKFWGRCFICPKWLFAQ